MIATAAGWRGRANWISISSGVRSSNLTGSTPDRHGRQPEAIGPEARAHALSKQAHGIADDLSSAEAEPAIADRVRRAIVIVQGVEEETASLEDAKTPLTAESRLQLYHDVLQLLMGGQ